MLDTCNYIAADRDIPKNIPYIKDALYRPIAPNIEIIPSRNEPPLPSILSHFYPSIQCRNV